MAWSTPLMNPWMKAISLLSQRGLISIMAWSSTLRRWWTSSSAPCPAGERRFSLHAYISIILRKCHGGIALHLEFWTHRPFEWLSPHTLWLFYIHLSEQIQNGLWWIIKRNQMLLQLEWDCASQWEYGLSSTCLSQFRNCLNYRLIDCAWLIIRIAAIPCPVFPCIEEGPFIILLRSCLINVFFFIFQGQRPPSASSLTTSIQTRTITRAPFLWKLYPSARYTANV